MRKLIACVLFAGLAGVALVSPALADDGASVFTSGVNRPGGDFAQLNAASADDCNTRCAENVACASWVYNAGSAATDVSSPVNCWLKSEIPATRGATDMVSATATYPFEPGVNYHKHNIGHPTTIKSSNPRDCANLCTKNKDCVAFTAVMDLNGTQACWLKSKVEVIQARDANHISGRIDLF